MMRIGIGSLLFAMAAAGCASHPANERPEPNVVELVSVPSHAAVSLDCGAGTVAKGTTPVRVDVPRYPEVCWIDANAEGYRTLHMKFNRGLVLNEGQALRMDEHHALDQRAGTIDMVLFPLRNLSDRISNASAHAMTADYRLELKLIPIEK
jgi:hypothetical protein